MSIWDKYAKKAEIFAHTSFINAKSSNFALRMNKSNNIKNIIFDLGGVLVGLHPERCIDAFRKVGCGVLANYVEEHRTEDLFLDTELGRISQGEFCDEVRRMSATDTSDADIVWAWNQLLTGIPVAKLKRLQWLKSRGYRLFLLSNTNVMHWTLCRDHFFTVDGLTADDYFERIFLSYEMHLAKPSNEIFAQALGEAGIKAEETLFVDDREENCEGAARLGIDTLLETTGEDWMRMASAQCCATIGFFDGVHRGHQFVVDRLNSMAHEADMQSMVITFDRHPRQVVQADYVPRLITPLHEKLQLLRATGVDRVEVLHFDRQMASMSARDFMQHVLYERLGVRKLLIGYDNRFGHNRAEGFDDYVRYGAEIGMEVVHNTPVDVDGLRVSSSVVRRLLIDGNVEEAQRCLGHVFCIDGTVGHGFQEGRKIGFPTANIEPDTEEQLLPKSGVYAVRVSIEGGEWMKAMMNIGTNPTFHRDRLTLEAHIIDFDADIYGKRIRVEFVRRLRDERMFADADELRMQLAADLKECR